MPRSSKLVVLAVVAGSALVACQKRSEKSAPAGAATLTQAQTEADEPNPTPAPAPPGNPFLERFAAEKASRVKNTLSVETVFDKLRARGIALRDEKQHMGSVFQARYCVGARAGKTIGLSVCEYTDAGAAKKGGDESRRAFATLSERTVVQHAATTLTSMVAEPTAEDLALRDKIVAAFQE